ncbi:MAG: 50S ribosomal protein L15 [Planctomycetes bacterium]|nr:50S ribosomal protein L15 [Planctomycetota bacterium]
MNLNDVNEAVKQRKRRKRVGRGCGSGHGKTSGRGHKGQGQLAGWTAHPTFQGGAMPMVRRIPKRGFHNAFAPNIGIVNVASLDAAFADGDEVTPQTLRERGVLKGDWDEIKVLGKGELSKKLKISAHRFSKSAEELITKAGGVATVLAGPKPVVKNKMGSARRRRVEAKTK